MSSPRLTDILLALIAAALLSIAVRPYLQPTTVKAEVTNTDPFAFEPGVFMLRIPNGGQVLGRVAVNLRTGNVFGFPTTTNDPYPTSPIEAKPEVSHPIPLGRFALNEAGR